MLIREVFEECVNANVQALPFRNAAGELCGRVSIRDVLKKSCLPEHMVELAHVLSDELTCIDDADAKAREVLCQRAGDFVIPRFYSIGPDSSILRTLAIMEKYKSYYLFVANGEDYHGVVNAQSIARCMLEVYEACSVD
jgi:hypothetical protein